MALAPRARRRCARPDRLADAPSAGRPRRAGSRNPCHAGMIRVGYADVRHVREEDMFGVVAQRVLQGIQLVLREHHEHGLARRDALPHERDDAGHEPFVPRVEERLVPYPSIRARSP